MMGAGPRASGRWPPWRHSVNPDARRPFRRARRSGTPRGATAIAALATVAGFLALLVSPVPMVRGFGLLLIVGVAVAFAVACVIAPTGAARPASAPTDRLPPPRHAPRALIASVYGAGEILNGLLPALLRHPRRVLALGAVIAITGWALQAHTPVQSDITKLVPADKLAAEAEALSQSLLSRAAASLQGIKEYLKFASRMDPAGATAYSSVLNAAVSSSQPRHK